MVVVVVLVLLLCFPQTYRVRVHWFSFCLVGFFLIQIAFLSILALSCRFDSSIAHNAKKFAFLSCVHDKWHIDIGQLHITFRIYLTNDMQFASIQSSFIACQSAIDRELFFLFFFAFTALEMLCVMCRKSETATSRPLYLGKPFDVCRFDSFFFLLSFNWNSWLLTIWIKRKRTRKKSL